MRSIHDDIERVLISEEDIHECTKTLGQRISDDYGDEGVVVAGILKGGCVFMADLIREIRGPVEIDFMLVNKFGHSPESAGVVRIVKDLETDPAGKDLLLVEDIVTTGSTLNSLISYLYGRGARSVKICALLDKPSRRLVPVEVDYCGFEIPDEYVVGYGMDMDGKYRNLPYIGILKSDLCTEKQG